MTIFCNKIALFENKGWFYFEVLLRVHSQDTSKEKQLIIYILFVYFVYLDVNIYPSDPVDLWLL